MPLAFDLAKAIKASKVTKLSFSQNEQKLDGTGAAELAKLLAKNKSVTALSVADSYDIGKAGIAALINMLKTNDSLNCLSFSGCNLGGDGLARIAEALKTNSTLTELQIANDDFTDYDIKILCEALKTNKGVTSLKLSNTRFGAEAADYLAQMLQTNDKITVLGVPGNLLWDEGAAHLLSGVKDNRNLRRLQLDGTNISDASIGNIIKLLEANNTLKELVLNNNLLSDDSVDELAEAFRAKMKAMPDFNMKIAENNLSTYGYEAMADAFHDTDNIKDSYDLLVKTLKRDAIIEKLKDVISTPARENIPEDEYESSVIIFEALGIWEQNSAAKNLELLADAVRMLKKNTRLRRDNPLFGRLSNNKILFVISGVKLEYAAKIRDRIASVSRELPNYPVAGECYKADQESLKIIEAIG